jgi:hypothetical protein
LDIIGGVERSRDQIDLDQRRNGVSRMLVLDELKKGDIISGLGQIGIVSEVFKSTSGQEGVVAVRWAKNLMWQNGRPDLIFWSLLQKSITRATSIDLEGQLKAMYEEAQGVLMQNERTAV